MWNHRAAINPLDVTVKSAKSLGRNFAPTWSDSFYIFLKFLK